MSTIVGTGYPYSYGEKVTDALTGYVGKITAKCDYYGKRSTCYLVESIDSTGRPIETWVDETRLSPL